MSSSRPYRGRAALVVAVALVAAAPVPAAAAATAPPVLGTAPEFALRDQTGAELGSADLAGKVWLANFIFTTCRMTCPAQTQRFGLLAEALAAELAADRVELVSFSVDPEHDRPEVLRAYAAEAGADAASWHFLTGERETIWEVSAEGFRLPVGESPEPAGGPLFHSPQVVVVDQAGRIRGYFDGLSPEGGAQVEATVRALLVADPAAAETATSTAPAAAAETATSTAPAVRVTDDPDILDPPWLAARGAAQKAAVAELDLRTGFRFHDRQPESGIDFRHEVTPDGAKAFKVVHYDHGNGLATADVDGDGHLDVYLTSQVGPNGLYRNRGDGTFEDWTEKAGVAVAEPIKVTASFADVDNDGDPDLFVTSTRGGNVLLENDGTGTFRDITRQAGLDYVGHSSAGVFFDYDNDGLLDLYLANVGKFTTEELAPAGNERLGGDRKYWYYVAHDDAFSGHLKPERNEKSRLYRNEGGNRFRDTTDEMGLDDVAWTGDAMAADFDGDGWSDLYVLNMQGHDEYYQNREGRAFVRRSRDVFPKTPWGSMGAQVLDWNRDGRLDLYVTDMHSDMMEDLPSGPEEKRWANQRWPESLLRSGGSSLYGNAFYEQQADGSFAEVSRQVNAENYWPWGLSVADLNADGWPDAFIASSMNFNWRYHPNSLLLNDRGERWVDAEFVLGAEPRRDGRTAKPWFTLDCAGADKDHARCRQEGVEGRIAIWDALGSRASLVLDLEGDGDLDIVTNDFNSEPMVLVSDLADTRAEALNYLKVDLEGTRSNRDGIGARVTVRTADGEQHQFHDGRSGYLSQSVQPLYFGLGDARRVEEVVVRWPSGTVQTVPGPIAVDQPLRVVEPAAEAAARD